MISKIKLRCFIPILIVLLAVANVALAKALLKPAGDKYMPVYCKSASADVRIAGQFATTTLTLVYQHGSENNTEAEFVYELPDGAVATHFAYWAKDEKVIARIVEKKRAAEIYRKITEVRRDPALVEMIGKNKFRARISPVFAFEDLKIELVFVQVLPSVGGDMTYTLPLGDLCEKDDDLEEINVQIQAVPDENVIGVSNNYGLPVEKTASGYSVTLKGVNYNPPKDLSVRFKRKPAALLASIYSAPASKGGDGFFALALTPQHSLTNSKLAVTGVSAYDIVQSSAKVKAGESILVFGRYKGTGSASVTLQGKSASGPVSYKANAKFGKDPKAANLASKLWAAGKIEQLGKIKANRDAVVRMSLQFTLPSKYTSWLAVPKAEMAQFLYQKCSQQFDAAAAQWAKIIGAGEEQTAIGKKAQEHYNAWCAKVGFDPEKNIINYFWDPISLLANDLLKLTADGDENTPEFAANQARFDRLCSLLSPDEKWSVASILSYGDAAPFKDFVKMIADGKGESDEAKLLKTRLSKVLGDKYEEIIERAAYNAEYTTTKEMLEARWGIKPDLDKAAKLEIELKRMSEVFPFNQRYSSNQWKIQDTLEKLSYKIVDLTANGKNDVEYQTLLKRYEELREEVIGGRFLCIEGAAHEKINELAGTLLELKLSKQPNISAIKKIKAKMANLEKAYSTVSCKKANDSRESDYAASAVYSYMNFLEAGKQTSKDAIVLKKRAKLYGKLSDGDFAKRTAKLAEDRLETLAIEYAWARYGRSADPKTAKEILDSIHRMERVSGKSASKYIEEQKQEAMQESEITDPGIDAELLYGRFYMELCRNKPNMQRLEKLKAQIKPLVKKSLVSDRVAHSDWLLETGMSIADLQMEIRDAVARGDNAKAAESKKKHTEMLEQFRTSKYEVFRVGDPLISVEAPADAIQVIAIMPDGEIKILVYNASTKRWEGRFDVPAYAAEGSYTFSVVVVDKVGKRNVIAMKYGVDMTAPRADGAVSSDTARAVLEINASEDTARVVALLPWGERIELKSGEQTGSYCGVAAVPVEYQGKAYVTTFVLTDSAHNRTSVTVDSSK